MHLRCNSASQARMTRENLFSNGFVEHHIYRNVVHKIKISMMELTILDSIHC